MSFDEKMAKRFALERQVYLTVFFSIFRSFGLSYFMPYCFYASAHPIDELEALWFGVVCPSMHSAHAHTHTHTHTHPFNCPFSGTTQVSQYQKGKTNLDFTEARDSEWQWH